MGRNRMERTRAELAMGPLLRALRKHRGIELRELSRRTGVTVPSLHKIEHGTTVPMLGTLERICEVLDYEAWRMVRKAANLGVDEPTNVVEMECAA